MREQVKTMDLVVENFRPGRLAKWGIGYAALKTVNPNLIMVSSSGYGQTGPYRNRQEFNNIAESIGGLRAVTGYEEGEPLRVGVSLGDQVALTEDSMTENMVGGSIPRHWGQQRCGNFTFCYWSYRVSSRSRIANQCGASGTHFYPRTSCSLSFVTMMEIYATRWTIEVFLKKCSSTYNSTSAYHGITMLKLRT